MIELLQRAAALVPRPIENRSRIVVPDDAPATAANLNALESLWRLGLAG